MNTERDLLLAEYKEACEFIRVEMNIRRVALSFVTGLEAAIVAAVLQFDARTVEGIFLLKIALPLIGLLVAVIGLNNEWRIKKYTTAYQEQAHRLEEKLNFELLGPAYGRVKLVQRFFTGQAHYWFQALFILLISNWLIYFLIVLFRLLCTCLSCNSMHKYLFGTIPLDCIIR